jgi:enediyne biosynthesis protein CalE5
MPDPTHQSVLAEQRRTWDSLTEGWQTWRDTFERGGAVVTRRLLDLARPGPGDRILDVGCGCGEPSLSAAEAVGPDGHVVGVDIAPAMVTMARSRAGDLPQARFEVGDFRDLNLAAGSFDAVLSRWALMFLPGRAAALRDLRTLLRPGGRLAAAVWGPAPEALVVGLPFLAIGPRLQATPPPAAPADQPGPYAMSDPDRCRAELIDAGFTDVRVERLRAPFWMESPQTFTEYTKALLPQQVREILHQRLGSVDDPELWADVARLADAHRGADGTVQLPSTVLLLSGVAGPSH